MSPLDLLDLLGGTLVRGGLILAVAFLGVWLLRRRSAAGRYAVWAAAFAGLTLLPALTLVLPVLDHGDKDKPDAFSRYKGRHDRLGEKLDWEKVEIVAKVFDDQEPVTFTLED